jgi:1-acyl-sn-glycerol-3-phosphate acyltransferase
VTASEPRFNRWHFPLKRLLRFLLGLFVRLDAQGMDNIPATGPVIVYINHINWLDPVLAAGIIDREVTVMGKVELFTNPILGWVLKSYGVFPIRRTEGDLKAIKNALRILRKGGLMIISPEGHRGYSGGLQPAKAGMLSLATRAGVPIVPMAITGCQPIDDNMRRLRRTLVQVRVGDPYYPRADTDKPTREEIERLTDEAMARLAALLPPEYRGVYGDKGIDAGGFMAHRAADA